MFTSSGDTNSKDNLAELGGGGFGGYWRPRSGTRSPSPTSRRRLGCSPPARRSAGRSGTWSARSPSPSPRSLAWSTARRRRSPARAARPGRDSEPDAHLHQLRAAELRHPERAASPSPTCSYAGESNLDGCTTASAGTSPSPSPTCSYHGRDELQQHRPGRGDTVAHAHLLLQRADELQQYRRRRFPQATATATASRTKAGFAVAGTGLLLPGSLALAAARRRRRRGQRAGTPE